MWMGETPKNIAAIFSKARDERAVLLFDEAYRSLHTSQVASCMNHILPRLVTIESYATSRGLSCCFQPRTRGTVEP
jgi:aspartate/methionine/tyrosine aminotransferase